MHISPYSPARTARHLLIAVSLAALAALSFSPAQLWAASGSQYGSIGQYGEVTRIGGFDETAYDNDAYDGALTPGKFLNPVGFAVDTHDTTAGGDGTALYVLDRVSDYAEVTSQPGTEWRLQKLSDTDTVLGTTEFYLPKTPGGYNVPVAALGLAVDDTTGRIYTLIDEPGANETPVVTEILGWSTTPVSGKLVAPGEAGASYPALPADSVSTPVSGYTAPGLLSTASQLASASLYNPQGLTLDVTGGHDDLAIEADAASRNGIGETQGPTVVEQVSTSSGATDGHWISTQLAGLANASAADAQAFAAGISTNPDGSLSVLLLTTLGQDNPDTVKLSADLANATVLSSSSIVNLSDSWSQPLIVQDSLSGLPSSDALQLSNGLYAADYWVYGGLGYWNLSTTEGLRLIQPETGGLLSNPGLPATSIFDTLGNAAAGGACNISDGGVSQGANYVALAQGADGAVWVLTTGQDSSKGAEPVNVTGRQLIEFAPSKGSACVGPSGTFTLADTTAGTQSQPASTSTPLTVELGSTVEFDASSIDYPTSTRQSQAAIYGYEWDPTGAGYSLTSYSSELRPPTTASYKYTTPGVYTVRLRLLGDFGEYDESGTVVVQSASPPTATFTGPSSVQTGQVATFDSSGSQPASGAHIAAYHWNFGDGQTDDTQTPADSHAYASAGSYTVTLTVRDNDNRQSAPATQQITVSNPSSGGSPGGGGSTTTTTTPNITPPPTVNRSATVLSPAAAAGTGLVKVTVSCPATKASCAGTIQLKTASAVVASIAKASKRSKAKRKSVLVLGQKAFNLKAGQRETFTIKVSSKGLALLKRSKRLKVVVLVSAHDSFGDPGTATTALTLVAPAKKK
jgi:PKD repeat protein